MSVDVWATLRAGGREAFRLLEFSVLSVQLEPVFGYFVWRPRIRPCLVQAGFSRIATIGG